MLSKTTKSNFLIFCGLFFLVFLIVFTSSLNPFTFKRLESDTSVYLTIAQGITRGQVPYRDFVDNKGPLTYLISAPGMLLGGFTGVWITELIFMCVSIIFAYKTALFFGDKFISFWGVICSYIVMQAFFYQVAGTEEYALPFMMISLYIFTKYFFTKNEPPVYELIILGICFTVCFFLRINMFPLWLGFCVIIFFESLINKKYFSLIKYILLFCIGILIIAVPILLYLYHNNALNDYIHQNFIAGKSRGFSISSSKEFVRNFFQIMGMHYCFLPLPIYYTWIVKKRENINIYLCLGLLLAYLLTVFFFATMRPIALHNNIAFTTFLVPVFTFCINFLFNYFSNVKKKNIILLLFLCIVFAESISYYWWRLSQNFLDTSRKGLITIGKAIDQNTYIDDKIILLGDYCYIYLFTKRQSASRYVYQNAGLDNFIPNTREEFLHDIQENKPKIICITEQNGNYMYLPEWYSPIYSMIENEYRVLSSDNGYFLFIRDK